jgi:small-conductance mechanosensitive channel
LAAGEDREGSNGTLFVVFSDNQLLVMLNQFLGQFDHFPDLVWNILLAGIAILTGLALKFILSLLLKKRPKSTPAAFSLTRSIPARVGKPFSFFLPLFVFNIMLPLMKVRDLYRQGLEKTVEILLTLSISWILIGIIRIFEDYAYLSYDIKRSDNLRERKIRTQLQFIRRLAITLIIVVTVCIILLSFNNMRRLGAGLLTGVGLGGIIIGFAAQRSLGNLLAGFQIAFTQPIRIDDVLVVEGEWGRVEEITMTYVVLHIWDERRLILPINYFIEKPFQNWTRNESELMGTVFLYLDYTAPVDKLRTELTRLLESDSLWDKRVNALQVTNASDRTIEVRALMSARNSPDAFDLRCHVREGLIAYVREHSPESLPVNRAVINSMQPKEKQDRSETRE